MQHQVTTKLWGCTVESIDLRDGEFVCRVRKDGEIYSTHVTQINVRHVRSAAIDGQVVQSFTKDGADGELLEMDASRDTVKFLIEWHEFTPLRIFVKSYCVFGEVQVSIVEAE